DDADIADAGRDDALLLILETGHAHERFSQWLPAQDGHAVVGLLTAMQRLVARFAQCIIRKFAVLLLGFLQTQHVRLVGGQPFQYMRQADIERIDVPGGEFHAGLMERWNLPGPGRERFQLLWVLPVSCGIWPAGWIWDSRHHPAR